MQDHGVFTYHHFQLDIIHKSLCLFPLSRTGFAILSDQMCKFRLGMKGSQKQSFSEVIVSPILDDSFVVPITQGVRFCPLNFLMPALFYQSKSVYLTKPSGLLNIRKDKEHIDWRFIDVASDKRIRGVAEGDIVCLLHFLSVLRRCWCAKCYDGSMDIKATSGEAVEAMLHSTKVLFCN